MSTGLLLRAAHRKPKSSTVALGTYKAGGVIFAADFWAAASTGRTGAAALSEAADVATSTATLKLRAATAAAERADTAAATATLKIAAAVAAVEAADTRTATGALKIAASAAVAEAADHVTAASTLKIRAAAALAEAADTLSAQGQSTSVVTGQASLSERADVSAAAAALKLQAQAHATEAADLSVAVATLKLRAAAVLGEARDGVVAHGTLIGQGTFDYGPLARSAVGMASGGEAQGQASGGIVEARTGMSKRHDWDVFDIGAEWVIRVTCLGSDGAVLDVTSANPQLAITFRDQTITVTGTVLNGPAGLCQFVVLPAAQNALGPKKGKATYTAWVTLSGAPAPTDQLYGYWPLRQTEFANA
jgi:hypothetical protein